MTDVPHSHVRGNAPHTLTPPDSGQQPRVEFAHPFLRALAEAEHPEFKAPSGPDTTVFRWATTPKHNFVSAIFLSDPFSSPDLILLTTLSRPGSLASKVEFVRPADWWTSVNIAGALDELEGAIGIAHQSVELLKCAVAILADDERREP